MKSNAVTKVRDVAGVVREVSEVVMFPERDPKGTIIFKVQGRCTTSRGLSTPTLALENKREDAKEFLDRLQKQLDLVQTEDLCKRHG